MTGQEIEKRLRDLDNYVTNVNADLQELIGDYVALEEDFKTVCQFLAAAFPNPPVVRHRCSGH